MRCSTIAVAVGAALTLVGCERATAPSAPTSALRAASGVAFAKANTTKTHAWIDISSAVANPCNGEVIQLSGRLHLVTTITTDENTTTVTNHENFDALAGVGLETGLTYHLVAAAKDHETTETVTGTFVSSETHVEEQLVSQTSEDNFVLKLIQEQHVEGTTIVTTIKKTEAECR